MSTISQLSAAQLRRAAEVQTKIEGLQAELAKVLGGTSARGTAAKASVVPEPTVVHGRSLRKKRRLSAAGRARIVAASKAYWAKQRVAAPAKSKAAGAKAPTKRKRTMSAAGRARLAAIAKARWAKVKAAGKSKL